MEQTFTFGYIDEDTSLVHQTDEVLREAYAQFGMVMPDSEGNRSQMLRFLDLARLFRAAYRAKYRHSKHPARTKRIVGDVREFVSTGELPDYLKRVWFAKYLGEKRVQEHMKVGRLHSERFPLR